MTDKKPKRKSGRIDKMDGNEVETDINVLLNRVEVNTTKCEEIQSKLQESDIKLEVIKDKINELEGLDLYKYLKNEEEVDEVIDKRIASLLEITNQLKKLYPVKKEAIMDYLSKKSGVGKTKLEKVVKTFEYYLEKLI